jgi:hypothetical protein
VVIDSPTLLDALAARDAGIERADDHADNFWKLQAYALVVWCSRTLPTFTADDIWDELEKSDCTTHEPAALGPVFLRAARAGMIRKTGDLRPSRHPRRHRELTVWTAV